MSPHSIIWGQKLLKKHMPSQAVRQSGTDVHAQAGVAVQAHACTSDLAGCLENLHDSLADNFGQKPHGPVCMYNINTLEMQNALEQCLQPGWLTWNS